MSDNRPDRIPWNEFGRIWTISENRFGGIILPRVDREHVIQIKNNRTDDSGQEYQRQQIFYFADSSRFFDILTNKFGAASHTPAIGGGQKPR